MYRGCIVYSSSALMVVTSVGENTIYGKIAKELKESQPISPLKEKLTSLAKVISRIGYICSFLVSFYCFFQISCINKTAFMLRLCIKFLKG